MNNDMHSLPAIPQILFSTNNLNYTAIHKLRVSFLKLGLALILFGSGQYTMAQTPISTITQSGDTIIVDFTLPDFQIVDTSLFDPFGVTQIFKYINVDNFGIIDDLGFPELPQISIDLAIPNSTICSGIDVSNITTSTITIDKQIMPSQEYPEIGLPSFSYDTPYYSSDGSLYATGQQLSEPFFAFNQKGTTLTIFPFLYNPSLNKLTVTHSGRFKILLSPAQGNNNTYTSIPREDYLSAVFNNYTAQKSGAIHIGRYLIITPPQFENSLTYFANYKRNLGYTVNIVNTNTTGTSASQIQTYLQNIYNDENNRPDFVLLVGDVADIPASGGSEGDEEDPLTDLNYTKLSGEDYFADIFLGRWSVSSNDELQIIVNKTIFMESNLHKMNKRAYFLAGGGSYQNYFDNSLRWIMDNTFEPNSWSCTFNFATDGATRNDALNALNDNYLFFIYCGHGYSDASGLGTPFNLTGDDIDNATNTLYPMMFAFACYPGNFGEDDYNTAACFGERCIRSPRGGVSFFGSTITTITHTDNVIIKKVFGDAFTDEEQLGVMKDLGMKRYWLRTYSRLNKKRTKRYMKAYNLLGDPSFNKSGIGCVTDFIFNQDEIFNNGDTLSYHAINDIENNFDFTLNTGSGVNLLAGNTITLNPGFNALQGSLFHAFITPCTNDIILKSSKFTDTKISNAIDTKSNVSKDEDFVIAFPNPFLDNITFQFELVNDVNVTLSIYNQIGMKVISPLNAKLIHAGNTQEIINTSGLSLGIYIYSINIGGSIFSGKIIKTN